MSLESAWDLIAASLSWSFVSIVTQLATALVVLPAYVLSAYLILRFLKLRGRISVTIDLGREPKLEAAEGEERQV